MACIQPNLSSGEAVDSPRAPDTPSSWWFVLGGFMTPWSFDAFGSGCYASKRVGSIGPTMVLSETQGLQLFWVMRGAVTWEAGEVIVRREERPRPDLISHDEYPRSYSGKATTCRKRSDNVPAIERSASEP